MYTILFVDDEKAIRDGFKEYAEFLGYQVTEAKDGKEAIQICRDTTFDIIILDIMMPNVDGFTALKEIRKLTDVPAVMLSARSEEYDKLYAFELGVDDYVTKPFSPKELLARIQAIIKRYQDKITKRKEYQLDTLYIDFDARTVHIDDALVSTTPKEYELLIYLVENKNIALSREKILETVWGYDFYGDDSTVNTHIKMLRSHLGEYKDHIVTLRGVGYRFEE